MIPPKPKEWERRESTLIFNTSGGLRDCYTRRENAARASFAKETLVLFSF